jgi:hypothetical protein
VSYRGPRGMTLLQVWIVLGGVAGVIVLSLLGVIQP